MATDAQADGKNFDELNQSTQDMLKGYIGISLKIDGNEYVRKQQTPLMFLCNKGNMQISSDMKEVTFTDSKIAKGGDKQWTTLPKALLIQEFPNIKDRIVNE